MDTDTWHEGKVRSYMPKLAQFEIYFEKVSGQRQIKKLRTDLPSKLIRFLGVAGLAAKVLLQPIPTLADEPASVILLAAQPRSLTEQLAVPPPPLADLDARERSLLVRAQQKAGLVRCWSDNIPLTDKEFAQLRPVPADISAADAETYYLNDECMNAESAQFNFCNLQ